jgi:hypothetical protein
MIRFVEKLTWAIELVPVLALLIAPSLYAEDKIVGRVRDVQCNAVHACFYSDATPSVGDILVLERPAVGAHPKRGTLIRPERCRHRAHSGGRFGSLRRRSGYGWFRP